MSTAATPRELLSVCIGDLISGRRLAAESLPPIADMAGPSLAPVIFRLGQAFADQADRMQPFAGESGGPPNIWMKGILDDAARDTRTIAEGRLLDIALIGAARKAVAADSVSLETANALARSFGEQRLAAEIEMMGGQIRDMDQLLRLELYETAREL